MFAAKLRILGNVFTQTDPCVVVRNWATVTPTVSLSRAESHERHIYFCLHFVFNDLFVPVPRETTNTT